MSHFAPRIVVFHKSLILNAHHHSPTHSLAQVLFKQLFETHPRIIDDIEAPYTVAMLQEMFYQIDYNGDGTTNWDEFTSFCVQTGALINFSLFRCCVQCTSLAFNARIINHVTTLFNNISLSQVCL